METRLKRKRIYGPDVHLVQRGEKACVEKTYRSRPWPTRKAGWLLVRWETYIYSKIQGIPGIPQVIQSADAYTLTTTFMGGHNLRDRRIRPDEIYFARLEEIIEAIHRNGVVHLDMRNRRNYGIDDQGRPYLVDFASGIYTPFKGPAWRMLCRIDWMGYLKVKAKLNPALLSSHDRRMNRLGKTLSRLWLPSKILPGLRGLFRRVFR